MIKINPKAQSWSIDIMFGVIIFLAAFFVFFVILGENPNSKINKLKEEASFIIKQLVSGEPPIRVVDNLNVNISKLNQLKNLSYGQSKSLLRIDSDFCIYLEDEKGSLVIINNSYKGIGAPNINLSGAPCSQK